MSTGPSVKLDINADFSKIGMNNENIKITGINFYVESLNDISTINMHLKYIETTIYNANAKNGVEYTTTYPIPWGIRQTDICIFKCGNISEQITIYQGK